MTSIVIIGGGFAGFNAALAAARVSDGRISVMLVSRDGWLTIRPRLYESHPATLRTDLLKPLSTVGIAFLAGEVVDLSDQSLELRSGATVPFDRVIVTVGSVMKRPDIPGASEACSIDDWAAAMAFDEKLAAMACNPAPRVAIIGAGFTGLELALEMRDRIAAYADPDAAERAQILLLDSAGEVGAELGVGPRLPIRQALAEAGIETLLNVQITGIGERSVFLKDGREIACDAVVLCTGLEAAPLVKRIKGAKDRHGRLVTDPFLRAPDARHIFVAGDAACAAPEPGQETLMSCQHALTLGKYAGENAARELLGMPLISYAQPRYVTCLALGRSGAVYSEGWDRIPIQTGDRAKAIKTEINTRRIYPPVGTRDETLAASRIQ